MRWELRAAVDAAKACVPFQAPLRRLKHRYVGYDDKPGREAWTIEEGLVQIGWLRDAGFCFERATVLEIGTGWQPLIPLLYAIAGCRSILLVDAVPLLEPALVARAVALLANKIPEIADRLTLPEHVVASRLAFTPSARLSDCLAPFNMRYLAPADARRLPIESGSLDLIFSRAVLEHIPASVLGGIVTEARRVLAPGGRMLHFIDTADHWAFDDARISRVHFLTLSDFAWRLTCLHPQNYQNRLRPSEYLTMLRGEGFDVVRTEVKLDPRSLAALPTMLLAERFRGMAPDDLTAIDSRILAVRA